MRKFLMPDLLLSGYREVTPQLCRAWGIRTILSDIDNTLAPYEQPKTDEHIRAWVEGLREAGVSVALISNNHADRVEEFNADLGLVAYPDAGKPFGKRLRQAMAQLNADPLHTVMLGDQLLTDALAGNLLGLKVWIVPPIRDKRSAFVRWKRWLERPVLRKYRKKHAESQGGNS